MKQKTRPPHSRRPARRRGLKWKPYPRRNPDRRLIIRDNFKRAPLNALGARWSLNFEYLDGVDDRIEQMERRIRDLDILIFGDSR